MELVSDQFNMHFCTGTTGLYRLFWVFTSMSRIVSHKNWPCHGRTKTLNSILYTY